MIGSRGENMNNINKMVSFNQDEASLPQTGPEPRLTNTQDYTNRQTILFKVSSLTYPVDLIPLEASTRAIGSTRT